MEANDRNPQRQIAKLNLFHTVLQVGFVAALCYAAGNWEGC